MRAARGGATRRTEIARRLQTRLGAWLDGAARRIGLVCASAPSLIARPGTPTTETSPFARTRSSSAHSKCSAATRRIFLPYDFGGVVDRIAGDDRAAARECARAPIELVGVAGDDLDIAYVYADLIGDDLREGRVVALTLRADAGYDAHFAARLHLRPSRLRTARCRCPRRSTRPRCRHACPAARNRGCSSRTKCS